MSFIERLHSVGRLRSNAGVMGILALADQALVSGTNFVTGVAVACNGEVALGQFSLAFSIIVIVANGMRAFVVTPYTVYARRSDEPRRRVLRGSTLVHFLSVMIGLLGVAACVLAIVFFAVGTGPTGVPDLAIEIAGKSVSETGAVGPPDADEPALPLFGLTIATTFAGFGFLIREYMRRMAFADLQFLSAVVMGSVSSGLMLAYLFVCWGKCNAISSLWMIGWTTLVPSLTLFLVRVSATSIQRLTLLADVWQNVQFGRWMAIAQLTNTAQVFAVHWILLFLGGVEATGKYAAAWLIVQLANPFLQGIGNSADPILARSFAEGGTARMGRTANNYTLLLAGTLIPFSVILLFFGPSLYQFIYPTHSPIPPLLPGL
ncbi:MAG: hypothetical protein AAFP90_22415, partial [Planctomycetota bacterium]